MHIFFSFSSPFFPLFCLGQVNVLRLSRFRRSLCTLTRCTVGVVFKLRWGAQWELCFLKKSAQWELRSSWQPLSLKLDSLKLGESKCFMILQNMMLGKLKAKTLWWLLRTLHFFKKKKKTINMRFSDSLILTVSPLAGRHCGCVRHRHREGLRDALLESENLR